MSEKAKLIQVLSLEEAIKDKEALQAELDEAENDKANMRKLIDLIQSQLDESMNQVDQKE